MRTYIDAIPFFGYEILANTLYSTVLFTIHYFAVFKIEESEQNSEASNVKTSYVKNPLDSEFLTTDEC